MEKSAINNEIMALHTPESFSMPHNAQPFEYELLKGHYRTDRSFKNDEQLRSEYVQLTDELIRQMTEGVYVRDRETGKLEQKRPDYVIWLDKSARPVSWLTKELWPVLAADENGQVPDMPAFRYVNIDREQWVNTIDPNGTGYLDVNRVDRSVIRSLRSIFVAPEYEKNGLTEEIDTAPSELDGKTVLIVDEVKASGRTLDIAQKFFARAFPDTKIATAHWMSALTQIRDNRGYADAQGNADLPVWYKEHDISGRGVGNRDERLSQRSKSRTQRLGAWFLSTRLAEKDPDSLQLRTELAQLAKDLVDKKVLYVPSQGREIEDMVDRAERLNGLTFEEFINAKRQLNNEV